ncbi:unnamed protein product [Diamesa hyperborea]
MHLVFSAWIFYESSILGWMTDYSFRCQPVDYATTGKPMRLAEISWWYFMSKIIDLAETFFYVLEKRFHLITVYHVVHHSIMLFVWLGVKYVPGGHITFFAWINCFVHLFIYGYLVLRTVAPAFKTYLLIAKTYFPMGGKKDKQPTKPKEIKEVEVKETPDLTNDNEGDLNSGFSSYLQSSSGINQLNSTKSF